MQVDHCILPVYLRARLNATIPIEDVHALFTLSQLFVSAKFTRMLKNKIFCGTSDKIFFALFSGYPSRFPHKWNL